MKDINHGVTRYEGVESLAWNYGFTRYEGEGLPGMKERVYLV
jgi:hypothetical protein